jgi:hypothetical protein
MVELIEGTNVKFFSGNNLSWDTNSLRTQSVMNNYALTVNDRMELCRKIRTEGLEKLSLVYQLYNLMVGDTPTQNQQPISKKRNNAKGGLPATATSGDYSAVTPLVSNVEEEETSKPAADTESRLKNLLDEAELNNLGLSTYPMYQFDR